MGHGGEGWYDLLFLGLLVVLVPLAAHYAHRGAKRADVRARAMLASRGYVVAHAYQPHRGPVTQIWARCSRPVPYLQVSNRDLVQVVAGNLGVADIAVGDPEFDRSFVVRGQDPQWVRRVLSPDLRADLRRAGDVQFLTGSIDSLLGADLLREVKEERNRRALWMLRTGGKLDEAQAGPLLDLGRRLAAAVEGSLGAAALGDADSRTSFFEGR